MNIINHFYKVKVTDTNEEQKFMTHPECIQWIRKVKHTFGDDDMDFSIIEVIEIER